MFELMPCGTRMFVSNLVYRVSAPAPVPVVWVLLEVLLHLGKVQAGLG
jgi:hypothetical protein